MECEIMQLYQVTLYQSGSDGIGLHRCHVVVKLSAIEFISGTVQHGDIVRFLCLTLAEKHV